MFSIHKKDMSPAIRAKLNLFEDNSADSLSGGDPLERRNLANGIPTPPTLPMGPLLDPQGLILPRKIGNPVLESRDHRDLNREIIFNQKIGKSVLNQKSELQKVFQKQKDHQIRKEMENERNQNKSVLERAIEERARRLDQQSEKKDDHSVRVPEFLQVHAKVCGVKEGK